MEVSTLVVPGVPHAEQRKRSTLVYAPGKEVRIMRGRQVWRVYRDCCLVQVPDKDTDRQRKRFREAGIASWRGRELLDGPLIAEFMFVFPRPKALVWKRKPMSMIRKGTKPDLDNLEKLPMDALEGVWGWKTDGQIAGWGPRHGTWYGGAWWDLNHTPQLGHAIPRTVIRVWKAEEDHAGEGNQARLI